MLQQQLNTREDDMYALQSKNLTTLTCVKYHVAIFSHVFNLNDFLDFDKDSPGMRHNIHRKPYGIQHNNNSNFSLTEFIVRVTVIYPPLSVIYLYGVITYS